MFALAVRGGGGVVNHFRNPEGVGRASENVVRMLSKFCGFTLSGSQLVQAREKFRTLEKKGVYFKRADKPGGDYAIPGRNGLLSGTVDQVVQTVLSGKIPFNLPETRDAVSSSMNEVKASGSRDPKLFLLQKILNEADK